MTDGADGSLDLWLDATLAAQLMDLRARLRDESDLGSFARQALLRGLEAMESELCTESLASEDSFLEDVVCRAQENMRKGRTLAAIRLLETGLRDCPAPPLIEARARDLLADALELLVPAPGAQPAQGAVLSQRERALALLERSQQTSLEPGPKLQRLIGEARHIPDLFFSYARMDEKVVLETARLVRKAIHPRRVLLDAWVFRPGTSLGDSIRSAMFGSQTVVVFLTPTYLERPWCRGELEHLTNATAPVELVPLTDADRNLRTIRDLGQTTPALSTIQAPPRLLILLPPEYEIPFELQDLLLVPCPVWSAPNLSEIILGRVKADVPGHGQDEVPGE
jgi:TIR domain